MTVYVALLRNINVGGHPLFTMADLRAAVEELGYRDVRTYIQTGNVIFEAGTGPSAVAAALEDLLAKRFEVTTSALVRTATELAEITVSNPFAADAAEAKHLHVTFLAEPPATDVEVLSTASAAGEGYALKGRELYLHCPNGYGRTKLNNTLVERRLGVRATTRNWNSVTRLAAMAAG